MNDNLSHSELGALWQSQPTEPPRMSPEELRSRMHRFERRIFWRNLREYAAGVVVLIVFGYYEWLFPALLQRIGSTLTIAGTLYVMYQLHRRASARISPADAGMKSCLEYHRQELERQRDALRAVWSWYLLPFVPGMAVFLAGMMVKSMEGASGPASPNAGRIRSSGSDYGHGVFCGLEVESMVSEEAPGSNRRTGCADAVMRLRVMRLRGMRSHRIRIHERYTCWFQRRICRSHRK